MSSANTSGRYHLNGSQFVTSVNGDWNGSTGHMSVSSNDGPAFSVPASSGAFSGTQCKITSIKFGYTGQPIGSTNKQAHCVMTLDNQGNKVGYQVIEEATGTVLLDVPPTSLEFGSVSVSAAPV